MFDYKAYSVLFLINFKIYNYLKKCIDMILQKVIN